ncbi:hypothetical protein HS088_TW15G01036 [Tripterygium wilfordii]|uniref:Pyrrolo-quinoline quinone repeat domain-containing protein n=1 Tax=Tripterygium wilfordii TaxID=458696 RepID=A0A7J7CND7_TRIWF|nr:hypothetical protein HS088_TW15G01036 [Tripterygium wilfordii]
MYHPTNITANPVPCENSQNWLNHGGDLKNRRYADKETKINPITASKLKLKWEFYAGRDITATPAIFNGTLYFPSWNGNIYAVKASDGSLVWKKNVSEVTGINAPGFIRGVNSTVSRSTPTIAEDLVIVGLYAPCVVIALEMLTGKLVWMTQLDKHPSSVVTMSGTYYNGSFYVGASSLEEGRRGGYAGAAIWGSSPSIDINRNLVYIATGNLYSAPERVTECQERQNNQTSPTQPDECIEPDNHSNSFLALELETGKIRWYRQLGGYDVWFFACNNLSTPNCPPGPNPDADFGEAPMMLSVFVHGRMKDIVVAVQKSGFAWALDRDNGSLIWSTEVGPGGMAGGGTWGSATDEKRVYTNLVNSNRYNFTLKPSNRFTNGG